MRFGHQPSNRIPQERIVRSTQRKNLPGDRQFRLAELADDVRDGAAGEAGELAERLHIFPWKRNRKAIDLAGRTQQRPTRAGR